MITKRAFLAATTGLLIWANLALAEGWEERALTADELANSGALVVDIRTPEEWAETGVLPGARLMTFADADSFLASLGADLADGRDLVLVCRSGRRSGAAAEALAGRISNRIISQAGGMSALIEGGLQTVAPQN